MCVLEASQKSPLCKTRKTPSGANTGCPFFLAQTIRIIISLGCDFLEGQAENETVGRVI